VKTIWRSLTGFYSLQESAGRYYPTAGGSSYPVALTREELAALGEVIDHELGRGRRPGPTETKTGKPRGKGA
jgi:hypothetical protein